MIEKGASYAQIIPNISDLEQKQMIILPAENGTSVARKITGMEQSEGSYSLNLSNEVEADEVFKIFSFSGVSDFSSFFENTGEKKVAADLAVFGQVNADGDLLRSFLKIGQSYFGHDEEQGDYTITEAEWNQITSSADADGNILIELHNLSVCASGKMNTDKMEEKQYWGDWLESEVHFDENVKIVTNRPLDFRGETFYITPVIPVSGTSGAVSLQIAVSARQDADGELVTEYGIQGVSTGFSAKKRTRNLYIEGEEYYDGVLETESASYFRSEKTVHMYLFNSMILSESVTKTGNAVRMAETRFGAKEGEEQKTVSLHPDKILFFPLGKNSILEERLKRYKIYYAGTYQSTSLDVGRQRRSNTLIYDEEGHLVNTIYGSAESGIDSEDTTSFENKLYEEYRVKYTRKTSKMFEDISEKLNRFFNDLLAMS